METDDFRLMTVDMYERIVDMDFTVWRWIGHVRLIDFMTEGMKTTITVDYCKICDFLMCQLNFDESEVRSLGACDYYLEYRGS